MIHIIKIIIFPFSKKPSELKPKKLDNSTLTLDDNFNKLDYKIINTI